MNKEIPSLLASIFPLYTLVTNTEFEKKIGKHLVFSTKIQLEGLAIARSIDNFPVNHFNYLKFETRL